MENGKVMIFYKIMKFPFVSLPKSSKSLCLPEKYKNQKHSPVVNAISHRAMFSRMQNFTLASTLNILLLNLKDFLSYLTLFALVIQHEEREGENESEFSFVISTRLLQAFFSIFFFFRVH